MACTVEEINELLGAELIVDVEKLKDLARYGLPAAVRAQRQPPSTDFISAQVDSAQPKTFPPAASGAGSQAERTTGEVVQTVRGYIERFCADVQSERNFFLKPETRHTMETILVTLLQTHAPSPLLANPASIYLLAPFVFIMPKPELALLCFEGLLNKLEQTQPFSRLPKQVGHTMMLFRSLYPQLSSYFEECGVQPNDWIQRWLQFLLARELPMPSLLRLWDTYFAEGISLHMCALRVAIIIDSFSEELMQLGDVELKYLLLHLPKLDCDQIVFEAYNIRDECNDEA